VKIERFAVPFEYKTLGAGDSHVFEGYGSVFGGIDTYGDTVVKGAFKDTLNAWKAKGKLPKMLLQHGGLGLSADDMVPIGKWEEMREDDTGLYVKGRLFDVQTDRARNTYAAMREGELDGLSIGFSDKGSSIDKSTGIRKLTAIDLWEISPVTWGADRSALVTGVKADGELPTEREFERWLRREAGFTDAEAKTIIAKGYRQVRREAMPSEEACGDLIESIRRFGAIASGAQRT